MPVVTDQLYVQDKPNAMQRASMWSAFYEKAKVSLRLPICVNTTPAAVVQALN